MNNTNVATFKLLVNKKFGIRGHKGLGSFCRASGLNLEETVQFLSLCDNGMNDRKQKKLNALYELAMKKRRDDDPKKIGENLRLKLNKEVELRGGPVQFCKDNPQFSKDSLYQILSGKRHRVSKKVKELIDKLEIDLH